MVQGDHKVFDLELVGVPVQRRRRWRTAVAFALGLMAGVSGAIFYYQPMVARQDAADQRSARLAAQQEAASFRGQLTGAMGRLEALQGDLTQMRYERDRLLGDLERLQRALSDSEDARAQAEAMMRRAGPSSPVPPRPPEFATMESERSPPPVSVDRFLPEDYEEEPEIQRIFVARRSGIMLEDLSRHYGVSVRRLRLANPELRFVRGNAGTLIPAGSRVRIPVAE